MTSRNPPIIFAAVNSVVREGNLSARRQKAPKARTVKSVWRNVLSLRDKNVKKPKKKEGKQCCRMTRCEFTLWQRSYRTCNDHIGQSSREASILNWNSNCKCNHWKSTLNLLSVRTTVYGKGVVMEREQGGGGYPEVFNCTSTID